MVAQWQESSCQSRRCRLDPWVGKSPWRRKWKPIPVFLPGKSHAQRCVVGCNPWGCKRTGHDVTTKHHHQQPCNWPLGYEQIPLSVSAGPTGAGRRQVWGCSKGCVLNRLRCPCDNYVETESKRESDSVVSNSLQLHGLYSPWNSPGQNTGVGSLSLLQGIFPTQGSNPGLPQCRWILYQLN